MYFSKYYDDKLYQNVVLNFGFFIQVNRNKNNFIHEINIFLDIYV